MLLINLLIMKRIISFLMFSALTVFALVMLFPSCEGPQGPAGLAGADGTDGTDGVDANSWCITCHTLAVKNAVKAEFALSSHGPLNGSYGRGSAVGCAKCHDYKGYLETKLTGRDTTAAINPIPMHFQCDMCHDFHETLDSLEFPDYALRQVEPVSLMFNQHTSTVDFKSSANLCAYCHQPRFTTGFPIVVGSDVEYKPTNNRWGPHYGTETLILNAADCYEVPGSLPYTDSGHKNVASCATCHMATPIGNTGGHTFFPNVNGCTSCHPGATDFNINGRQTEIHDLFEELGQLLQDAKLIDATLHSVAYTSALGKGSPWTSEEAGAVFNFLVVEYDASFGAHNYKYTKALLTNTIEMVKRW